MSADAVTYRVVLWPQMEVAAQGLSQREAQAWVQAYNQIMQSPRRQAMLTQEQGENRAA